MIPSKQRLSPADLEILVKLFFRLVYLSCFAEEHIIVCLLFAVENVFWGESIHVTLA